jgi:glycosyltransferase involved in cell wall biosynthesis
MKVAVFNRYWTTYGGGERYAGAFAAALAGDHDVHVLSTTRVDWSRLEERLRLDLSRTSRRVVPADPHLVTAISREYDVFVCSSFAGTEHNAAPRGIYVVLFPTHGGGSWRLAKRAAGRLVGPSLRRPDVDVLWGRGFYPAERSGLRIFRWTSEVAELHLALPAGTPTRVRLSFLAIRPRAMAPARVSVDVDGRDGACTTVGGDFKRVALDLDVRGRGADDPVDLLIRSDTFVPDDGRSGDDRRLGVPLSSVQVGLGARAWLAGRFPFLATSERHLDALESYGDVVSISEFTRQWVARRWGRESHVIHPPVDAPTGGEGKQPIIVSVGRFFDHRFGHSKKQLELVRAFRTLVRRGLSGWELHFVGSCQQRHAGYLERVRAEADGLPVRFHVDASGAELNALYGRASIYWHAAGLGESARRHPERFEHFGISTVEAMGAGAVPLVLGDGGQAEIVQDGVNGYLFHSTRELVARTEMVAADAGLRHRLATAAQLRAAEFSTPRFAERVRALVAGAPSVRA